MKLSVNKFKAIIIFLFFSFSILYFSYFPGAYSFDSVFLLLDSLGYANYNVATSPLSSIFLKIFFNYSFGSFLSLYILIILSFFLLFRNKLYFSGIFFGLILCTPAVLQTVVFAWKDNFLAILMLISILFYEKQNNIGVNKFIVLAILFLAFTMRVNSVFAITPILFLVFNCLCWYKKILMVLITLTCFSFFNHTVNTYLFDAKTTSMETSIPLTDIAKMNYYSRSSIENHIPDIFLIKDNLESNNVKKMFSYYNDFCCNDILYMYKNWHDANAFLTLSKASEIDNSKLKYNWFKYILSNPKLYLEIRYIQWSNSLFSLNVPIPKYSLNPSNDIQKITSSGGMIRVFNYNDISNKIYQPLNINIAKIIIDKYELMLKNDIIRDISYPVGYLLLEIILLMVLIIKNDHRFYLVKSVMLSGIFYSIGYFPIMPCTDYRYFLWTVISCFFSFGLFLDYNNQNLKGSHDE